MTRTDSQRDASRRNGSLSLGPITPQGRLTAARNATQHGFTGGGKCLPPDMEAELQAAIQLYNARHQPRDDYEHDLIRRAALGNVRARRLATAANAATDERTRNAVRHWDEARTDEVAALAERLDHEPEAAVRLLKRTAHGCDSLGDAWEALGQVLTSAGFWDEPQSRRALRLLGFADAPTPTGPEPLWTFWLCVLALRFERDPEPLLRTSFRHWNDAEAVRRYLPAPAEARDALTEFVRERIAEMETLGSQLWDDYDAPSRTPPRPAPRSTPAPRWPAWSATSGTPSACAARRSTNWPDSVAMNPADRPRRCATTPIPRPRRRSAPRIARRKTNPSRPPRLRHDCRKSLRRLVLCRLPRSPAPISTASFSRLQPRPPSPWRSVGPPRRAGLGPPPVDGGPRPALQETCRMHQRGHEESF